MLCMQHALLRFNCSCVGLHEIEIQRPRFPNPRHKFCVVSIPISRVGMDEHSAHTSIVKKRLTESVEDARAWATVHDEPAEERAGLVRRKGVDFEHGHWVRTYKELID